MVIVIFGDDAAACTAAHAYRKIVRRGEVVIVRSSDRIGYLRSLLPYYAAGLIEKFELFSPVLLEVADLVELERSENVALSDGELKVGDKVYAKPLILVSAWQREGGAKVINLLTPEESEKLSEALSKADEVTVIGGITALPVVDALVKANYPVSLVWNDTCFDNDISTLIREDLQKSGVKLLVQRPAPQSVKLIVNYGEGTHLNLPVKLPLRNGKLIVDSSCRLLGCEASALGLATEVLEPEGWSHSVRCEEETLLQATNFAARAAGIAFPVLRRYFVARFKGKVYASFGLTMREAEIAGYDAAATRVRGWGKHSDAILKIVASREGRLLGAQAIVKSEEELALGLLYVAVLSQMRLLEASRALSPVDPEYPTADNIFSKAFNALLRKVVISRLAKSLQRAE